MTPVFLLCKFIKHLENTKLKKHKFFKKILNINHRENKGLECRVLPNW